MSDPQGNGGSASGAGAAAPLAGPRLSSRTPGAQETRPRLVRAIGRVDLTAVIINSIIGSGIFAAPATVAGFTGAWSPLAVLLGAAGLATVVLCFAEVGSRFEETGGPYLYARAAFGPAAGFHVGWLHVWTRVFSGAAVLNVFVSYLTPLVPWAGTPHGRLAVMTTVILLVSVVNVMGVRLAVWAVDAFTLAKLLPLVLLVVLGLPRLSGEVLASQAVPVTHWADAVLFLVFLYGGFESGVIAAAETRRPRRDTGFALVVALGAVAVIYCFIQLVVVGVVAHAASSPVPVAAALGVLLGPAGSVLGSLTALVSGYGWLLGFAFMTPRVLFCMGERRELPALLGSVHRRFRTPHVAIASNSIITLAIGLYGRFDDAAALAALMRLLLYGATCAALPRLRALDPEERPGFRLRGGSAVAVVALCFCLWLLLTRSSGQLWLLLATMLAGGLLWWLRGEPPA